MDLFSPTIAIEYSVNVWADLDRVGERVRMWSNINGIKIL